MDEPTLRGCLVAVPPGLVEELTRRTSAIRPEEVARARKHLADGNFDCQSVWSEVASSLLALSA